MTELKHVYLRRANKDDFERIYEWRNNPWIISLGNSQKKVTKTEHQKWFNMVIGGQKRCLLNIIEQAGAAIGSVRIERDSEYAVISVYLLKDWTGKGFGVQAIKQACAKAFQIWGIDGIVAKIRSDNKPSIKAFMKAGFEFPKEQSSENENISLEKKRVVSGGEMSGSFYRDLLNKYSKEDGRALGWGSSASQGIRFKVLLNMGDCHNASILDVGCGAGHLLDILYSRGFTGSYTGIDLVPEMVKAAKERHPKNDFQSCHIDEVKVGFYDYVLASGVFTFANWDIFCATISDMYQRSKIGVGFNCLSSWFHGKESGEFYANPSKTIEFCRSLTPYVTVRHDYLPNDFSVYMFRNKNKT